VPTIAPGTLKDNPSLPHSRRDGQVDLNSPMHGVGPSLPYPVKAAVTRVRSALWLARSRGRANENGIRVLFYHRVSDERDDLAVHPRKFREQMDYLAGAGYRVVDIVQVADLLDAGETPTRTVALNFDDGRTSFAWYRRQPPLLGWDEIAELDRGGTLEFEAHTVTHPNLLAVDDRRAVGEVEDSKHELEARLGRRVTALSYPAGLFGERERRLAVAAGYRVAVSCEPGVNVPDTDRFALKRRQIDARDRLFDFRAKVSGGHDTPLPLRGVYRQLRYGEGRGKPRLASTRR
jgi:peptidoglycan/xylan/chitin deacetylase (PgdA/CDA1 family)